MISPNTEDVATVISILPIRISEEKPLVPSLYIIPAAINPDRPVESLMIRRGSFKVYIDESRPALVVPETADTIAEAICRDFKVASSHFEPGVAEPGLTWVRGGYETSEILLAKELRGVLSTARALQNNWFKKLVATADDDWGRHKLRKMISDLQRLACKQLNLERPWDIDVEVDSAVRLIPCKFCRADIHPQALICAHCRGILDMARYKSEFVSIDTVSRDK